MDDAIVQTSLDLAGELASNAAEDVRTSRFVDPRTLPTRFSLLKQMSLSPAHYLEACQRDQDDSLVARLAAFSRDQTDRANTFRIGRAIHAMLVDGKVVVYGGGRRDPRAKAWQEFQAEAAAKGVAEILIASEMSVVQGVVDAIRARPDAMKLLFDGTKREQRIDWEWMGKQVRSTPDARSQTHSVDLKSTVSADPEPFRRQALRLGYHAQAELYDRAIVANSEPRVDSHFVIAVEKTRPHPVTIFRFTAEMLELGARMNRRWMERLQQCELANVWPEYAPCGVVIDLDVEEEWAA